MIPTHFSYQREHSTETVLFKVYGEGSIAILILCDLPAAFDMILLQFFFDMKGSILDEVIFF